MAQCGNPDAVRFFVEVIQQNTHGSSNQAEQQRSCHRSTPIGGAVFIACQKHIGKRFEDGLEFTPAMRVGCLMYIAFLYENREAVSPVEHSELPMAISALWSVYRDVGVY